MIGKLLRNTATFIKPHFQYKIQVTSSIRFESIIEQQ